MPACHLHRFASMLLLSVTMTASLALAACASAPVSPPLAAGKPSSTASDAPAYQVDPANSEIRLRVRRAGPLARLGHNHVVVAPVHGRLHVGETAADSSFRIEIRVEEFAVDPPVARREEGEDFNAAVSEEARVGTRENLLGEDLLDAAHHPRILVESLALAGPRWNPDVRARVTLRGVMREISFPAAVFVGDETVFVIANFTLLQSDFGIEPFSALGGALRVADELQVRMRVAAHSETR